MNIEHMFMFPSLQCLGERATMLRYTYTDYLVPVSSRKRKIQFQKT
jgi:hypothetical protein